MTAASQANLESHLSILSTDEVERARRFLHDADRLAFAAGRALVRRLLAAACKRSVHGMEFAKNQWGKPHLVGAPVQFNLANTKGAVGVGLCRDYAVGIDLEHSGAAADIDDVTEKVCTKAERCWISAQPPGASYVLWTLKEATAKAIGRGLSIPFQELEFQCSDKHAVLIDHGALLGCDETVHGLVVRVRDDYVLALVLIGASAMPPVSFFEYREPGQVRPYEPALLMEVVGPGARDS